MRVAAEVRLPDGSARELRPGDIIGRMRGAALCLDDPRISEAHALVSLRGSTLRLLALRGRMSVDGKPRSDAVLEPGDFALYDSTRPYALRFEADFEQIVLMLPGPVLRSQLSASERLTATTVQGGALAIDTSAGVKINDATVVKADVMASNGVIHVIDTVLMPPM